MAVIQPHYQNINTT